MAKGNFVEVFCSTPIDICEQRDVKGMYAKARAAVVDGKPMGFTGVDDPVRATPESGSHSRHRQHSRCKSVSITSSTRCSNWAISYPTGTLSTDRRTATVYSIGASPQACRRRVNAG